MLAAFTLIHFSFWLINSLVIFKGISHFSNMFGYHIHYAFILFHIFPLLDHFCLRPFPLKNLDTNFTLVQFHSSFLILALDQSSAHFALHHLYT